MPPHSPLSPPPRKPLPQPIEETTRSSNSRLADLDGSASGSGNGNGKGVIIGTKPRRALPQSVETNIKQSHSRNSSKDNSSHDHATESPTSAKAPLPPIQTTSSSELPKPRRFPPQIIDTQRRSRGNTDASPCLTPTDKPDATPAHQDHLPRHLRPNPLPLPLPVPPTNSPTVSSDHIPRVPESNFSSSNLAKKQERRHSFRVPDLPAIKSQTESEESNDSSGHSLSASPSAESDETQTSRHKKKRKKKVGVPRESQDGQYAGYLLSLAAKAAEKQLREQAMAAYPNENLHERVDHYAIDKDSEDLDVEAGVGNLGLGGAGNEDGRKPAGRRHRDSATGWDMAEMRRHQDKLEQQKRDQWATEQPENGRRRSVKKSIHDTGNVHKGGEVGDGPPKDIIGWQKDNEMKPMRNAASPPMAGENLKFPKCLSPQATRMDVNQYPGMKNYKGRLTRQHTGLWTPGGGSSRRNSVSGLWMGVNAAATQAKMVVPQAIRSGLLTPNFERADPFSANGDYGSHQLPPSPPSSLEDNKIDSTLHRELSIEQELNDTFVTQVYNYISLGYPSLARKFDEELSKITRVPIEHLRKDDGRVNAKGYVGAPEGTGSDVRGVMEGDTKCERWCALKNYVREWGKQQPEMGVREEADGGWGARARKGSWAI
ncbi:MAG: hypothetical protein ALECFALPRED_004856 [Alectoria fallacina]|uniref:Uncharacterized protein n=1 Tax=Alectoria fallacina TaxID=1903189 RepID=A0A8H3EGE2_9LECA|nr:MAG: hypothetical protein ALECFALPRED_004856 [Alectoria fallacina]